VSHRLVTITNRGASGPNRPLKKSGRGAEASERGERVLPLASSMRRRTRPDDVTAVPSVVTSRSASLSDE